MRWLESITSLMDTNLNKLWETEDRGTQCAASIGPQRIRHYLVTAQWQRNEAHIGTTRRRHADLKGVSSLLLLLTFSNSLSFPALWLQNYLSSPFIPSPLTLLLCGFTLFKAYKGFTERKHINIRQTLNPANVALKKETKNMYKFVWKFQVTPSS